MLVRILLNVREARGQNYIGKAKRVRTGYCTEFSSKGTRTCNDK